MFGALCVLCVLHHYVATLLTKASPFTFIVCQLCLYTCAGKHLNVLLHTVPFVMPSRSTLAVTFQHAHKYLFFYITIVVHELISQMVVFRKEINSGATSMSMYNSDGSFNWHSTGKKMLSCRCNQLRGLSPRVNYNYQAIAACRRS
jgi:hypothetical protein